MTEEQRENKKKVIRERHKRTLEMGKPAIDVNNVKNLYTYTHRGGDKLESLGPHARIPIRLHDLNSNEIMVLSYIEIHQFLDKGYSIHNRVRKPMPVSIFARKLKISERSVKRALAYLKKEGIISEAKSKRAKIKSYISNMMKKSVKYQIFTMKFISRDDFSSLTKNFLIRIMMLTTERITNLGNISALMDEIGLSRPTIKKALKELGDNEFLYEIEPGIFGINIKFISEELDKKIEIETSDLLVEIFDKDEEIKVLRKENAKLRKENVILREENAEMKEGISKYIR